MTNRKAMKYVPGLALAAFVLALAVSSGGCSAANNLQQAASGCDEFNGGAASVASLSIDANTKAFVTASADLVAVSAKMEDAVYTACKGICTDLGVPDTWSSKAAKDDQVTEACNQASAKIKAILDAQAQAQATCTLAVSGGQCTVDVNAEVSCTGQCMGAASCTPPDITVACDPGQLSGQCSGKCQAMATCEGTVMVAAQCQGSCEADCQGSCTPGTAPKIHCEGTCMGTCYGKCDATATGASGMASCMGVCSGDCDAKCIYMMGKPAHCEGTCAGTCTGNCKLDATATGDCGASVNCKGGCSVMYTAPKCEGTVKPPMCNADVNCQASCQSHAEATAVCTPPVATLECSVGASASADVTALITTVQTNMPAIVEAVETEGPIAVKAAGRVATTGAAVVQSVTSLGGKAFACAGAALQASAKASASINVSVSVSASVSGSCGGPKSAS
jgi:hypothetical protein